MVLVTFYQYLFATGRYLASRVKYGHFSIGACTLVPQIMRPSCAHDVMVHSTIAAGIGNLPCIIYFFIATL